MEGHKALLQSICGARDHDSVIMNACFCHWFFEDLPADTKPIMKLTLRGFLLEPLTLQKWFGEELEMIHNHDIDEECEHYCSAKEEWMRLGEIMIGMSLEATLEYFKQNKKI